MSVASSSRELIVISRDFPLVLQDETTCPRVKIARVTAVVLPGSSSFTARLRQVNPQGEIIAPILRAHQHPGFGSGSSPWDPGPGTPGTLAGKWLRQAR